MAYLIGILKKSLAQNPNAVPYKNKSTSLSTGLIVAISIFCFIPVIGLLAAIAIPNLLRARINVNDQTIQQDLRSLSNAIEDYRKTQNTYPQDINDLIAGDTSQATSGQIVKHGHNIGYTPGPMVNSAINQFILTADPRKNEALNGYCIDHTNSLRINERANATVQGGMCAGSAVN